MWVRVAIYAAVSVLLFWAAVHFDLRYRYEDVKDYLTLLGGVSGMVFTIMGIWIAFLYPNALSRLVDQDKVVTADFTESLADAKRLERIVAAVLISASVMLGELLVSLAKVFLSHASIYQQYGSVIRSGGLATIVFLTLVQVEAVLGVIVANVMFINDLHWKRQQRKANEEL